MTCLLVMSTKLSLQALSRILLLSFLSFSLFCCKSGPPPEMTDPGALIYYGYFSEDAQCSRCHGDAGQGGMFGPNVRDSVQKLGVDSVREVISYGRGRGDKKMPDFLGELNEMQIEQTIRFLQMWNTAAAIDSAAMNQSR